MKKIYNEKPIIFSILVVIATFLVLLLGGLVSTLCTSFIDDAYVINFIQEIIIAVYAFILISWCGQRYIYDPKAGSFGKGILTGGYFLFMGAFSAIYMMALLVSWDVLDAETKSAVQAMGVDFTGYQLMGVGHIAAFVMMMLLVGFAEETIFRGVIGEHLMKTIAHDKAGVKKVIVITGVLFGLLHLTNGISTGLTAACVQALITAFMGMCFAVVYFKSGSIWAVALLHTLVDFGSLCVRGGIYGTYDSAGVTDAMNYSATNLLGIIPYVIVALFLMRKKNVEIIAERYGINDSEISKNIYA